MKFLTIATLAACLSVSQANAETSMSSMGLHSDVVMNHMTTDSMSVTRGELMKTSQMQRIFERIGKLDARKRYKEAYQLAVKVALRGELALIDQNQNDVYLRAVDCYKRQTCDSTAIGINADTVYTKLVQDIRNGSISDRRAHLVAQRFLDTSRHY